MALKNAFISYRRADTKNLTHSLYKDLIREFSEQQIFMDVDDIQPGTDFVEEINKKLKDTHAMVVMIGPQWTTLENKDGQRRLFEPNDFVRIEVEQALKKKIKVFPVLVDNAVMPAEHELPMSIKSLSRLHALSLSSKDFNYQQHQVQQIIKSLAPVLDPKNQRASVAPVVKKKTFLQKVVRVFIWSGVILGCVVGLLAWLMSSNLNTPMAGNTQPAVQTQPTVATPPPQQVINTNTANNQMANQLSAELAKNGVRIGNDGSVTVSTSTDINGTWYDDRGGQHFFRQKGTVFTLESLVNNIRSATVTGMIVGNNIVFSDAKAHVEADNTHMQVVLNNGIQYRLHKEHFPQ